MKQTAFEIVRAQAEDAAALLEYLKIIGGETNNLSFGPEGVPLTVEAEQSYLAMQAQSHDHIQLLAKVNGEIIGTASLNRKPNRMNHRAEFGISLKKHGGAAARPPLWPRACLPSQERPGCSRSILRCAATTNARLRCMNGSAFESCVRSLISSISTES